MLAPIVIYRYTSSGNHKIGNKENRNSVCNLIVFDWISIKLRIFASGRKKLCPDILEFRRSVMLIKYLET